MFRHIAFTFLVFVIFAGIASAQGNDMEGLRASFEREIAAFNARDLDTLMDNQHDLVVALNPASPIPVDGKTARRQDYQALYETTERVTVTPKDPHFRVIDNTGIVWGEYSIVAKPKDKPETTTVARFSRTYVRSGGKWFLLLYHVSPLPAPPQ